MATQDKLNLTMLCDFYELTMGNGYFEKGYSCEDALMFAGKVASESVKYKGPREWIKYLPEIDED